MCFLYETFPSLVHLTKAVITCGLTICQNKLLGVTTTSGDSLQFPNWFSGKLLFHLIFNRNFCIFFLPNGKHPMYQFLLFILYTLNTSNVYKVNTFSLTSVLEKALSFAPKMYFPAVPAQDSLCFRNERVTDK